MPRFRAVTASQKNALDVLYQQYLKSVGLSVCLSVCPLTVRYDTIRYDTIRYDTRCYFNVRSKADISQLNLPHGTDN